MSLSQQAEIDTSVHLCTFECYIRQANISMKFPCTYFVQWRTVNAKSTSRTEKHSPQQNIVNFQERITLAVEMLYDHNKLEFLKRQTIVELYLISRSRPDQNKLVGRVNVDLGKVINVGMYESPTQFKLNFCSIQGNLIMQFKAKEQRLTNLTVQDLDKSSFIDFISQNALKNQSRNQSMILSRHQNHNVQRRSVEKATRSQIRSPISQAKESMKVNFNSKGSLIKAEAEKLFFVSNENQPSSPKARISDEFQAKIKISENHVKIKAQENPLTFQRQGQIVKQSKLQHIPSTHNINKDDQLPNKIMSFENFSKKISDVVVEESPSYINQDIVLNENKEMQDDNLLERKKQHEQVIAEKKQQISTLEAEAKKIKQQYYILMAEKGEIKEEKIRLADKAKLLASQLQQERRINSQGQEEILSLKAQLRQKDDLIQQLQREVESLRKPSQLQAYKARVSALQAINTQLSTQLNQYQTKLSQQMQQITSYEASLKQTKLQISQNLLKIQSLKAVELTLQNKLLSFQSENNRLSSHLQDYKKKYELQAQALNQSIELQKHQQEILQFQSLVSRLQSDLQEATRRCQTAQQELTYLQGKYMELQASKQPDVQTSQVIQNDNLSEVVEKVDKIVVEDTETLRLKLQNAGLINDIQNLKQNIQLAERTVREESDLRKEEERIHQNRVTSLQQEIEELIKANSQLQELARTRDELYRDNQALKGEIQQLNRQFFQSQDNSLAKMLQQQNQQLRQQSKAVQSQIQFYQKQLTILKEEIVRIRKSRESPVQRVTEYEQAIAKLNNNLEEQINQNNELSQAIVRYMEKQAKMKETLAVLQKQSKEIFTLVQEKQQNEQTYQKVIEELQCELSLLRQGQGKTAEISNKTYQQTTDQSHNDQFLKLQQKLLGENAQLAAANSEIREINTRLNEQLMQLSIEYNDFRQHCQEQLSSLKKQEEGYIGRIRDLQQGTKNKELEVEIWKSRSTQREGQKQAYEQEISRLRGYMEEIEEEKFNLESSNNQKDIRIIQLQQEITNFMNSLNAPPQINTTVPTSTISTTPSQQISLLSQLKDRLLTGTLSSDWQSLLQNVLDRSMLQQETSKLLNLEEKGRLLSKQLQKVKATLLKSDWRNHQEKIAAMSLFKKCESIVTELISAAESLNQNQSSFL